MRFTFRKPKSSPRRALPPEPCPGPRVRPVGAPATGRGSGVTTRAGGGVRCDPGPGQRPGPGPRRLAPRSRAGILLLPLAAACGRPTSTDDAPGGPGENGKAERPPNFVFLFADDLGYDDLGCYWTPRADPGYERIETPNIDRMAEEGVRFTSFCAADSICTPSRAAFLTGCYPARVGLSFPPEHHGVLRHDSPEGLDPKERTLAEVLREEGYATLCVGKWHLGNRMDFLPTRQGFDEYYGPVSRGKNQPAQMLEGERFAETVPHGEITTRYTERVIEFMERHRERPFFVFLSHGMPHVPLGASAPFRGSSARGLYGDAVAELDDSTGRLLEALARLELDRRTLVVFTSDNGPALAQGAQGGKAFPLRGGKSSAFEGGFRVPCVVRWPGRVPAGRTVDALATVMDFWPTFRRLAGRAGQAPASGAAVDGHDLWPLLSGEQAASPYEAFFYYRRAGLEAVRSGPWKLHLDERGAAAELFHLEQDPAEQRDRAPEQPDEVRRLLALAEGARDELGDGKLGRSGTGVRPVGVSDSAPVKELIEAAQRGSSGD